MYWETLLTQHGLYHPTCHRYLDSICEVLWFSHDQPVFHSPQWLCHFVLGRILCPANLIDQEIIPIRDNGRGRVATHELARVFGPANTDVVITVLENLKLGVRCGDGSGGE